MNDHHIDGSLDVDLGDGLPLDVLDDDRINDLHLDPVKVQEWLDEVTRKDYFKEWPDGDRMPEDYQGWS